jgi:osmotically inducible protein OsmC
MPTRRADAEWTGDGPNGQGKMRLGSGAFEGSYGFKSRMEDGPGTNPEELLGAAHAGCFSMALAFALTKGGTPPEHIHTKAEVHFGPKDGGFAISRIDLHTEAKVSGVDAAQFEKAAQGAKTGCPVSQALTGVEITLRAKLV